MDTLKKHYKKIVSVCVIALTIFLYIYYLRSHPGLLSPLKQTGWVAIAVLLVLYCFVMAALVLAYGAVLKLTKTHLDRTENVLLTMYSSIVNLFGPLQSGPGFRAVYLKKKHGLSIKTFAKATFFYYAFFGYFSVLFLLSGGPGWLLPAALVGSVVAGYTWWRVTKPEIHTSNLLLLAGATLLQLLFTLAVYFYELRLIDHSITLHQAVIYTGAASCALFVSLTPGALGFRESFLVLSQRLHHIDTQTIVAANVVDRAVYMLFLGLLFIVILSLHAKQKLNIK